jgi:predicted ABC-class ATPase
LRRHTRKKIKPQIVIFHNTAIDNEYIQKRFEEERVEIVSIPYRVRKMAPNKSNEEILTLIYALLIEFFSLPRLSCENFASAISCSSPPYDAMTEDLRRSLRC